MKVPMSWFNDYTDISGVTPKEYNDAMTMSGSKVEGIEEVGAEISNVVTAKITSVVKHPNADTLWVCQVDTGSEQLQIVTGADNIFEGAIVPVALHGAKLPGDITIKKGKLRGEVSNGMMCSHQELNMSEADFDFEVPQHGILILPEGTPLGVDVKDLFSLNENVVEFEITSNRPDCFSVIGLARETAVTFDKPFNLPTPAYTENSDDINKYLTVKVSDTEKCFRYAAKMIQNVKIAQSPKWLCDRLKACGVRPINNIVDITNYILLEYGQPMHAFDLRDINGRCINVRTASDGEKITTLDSQDRVLDSSMLVIADNERAIAVAGVMGAENSEVKPDTTTVIFECATFDAVSVRKAAKKLGLRTEASSRYEKGLDVNNIIPALSRACELVCQLGAGEVVGGIIDEFAAPKSPKAIEFDPDKINKFLGADISKEFMTDTLTKLGFELDGNTLYVPTFRPDVESMADVAEEVVRIYGYNNIPSTLLSGDTVQGGKTKAQQTEDKVKSILTSQGAYEIMTYSFTSPVIFDKLNIDEESPLRKTVQITNPLGEDTSIMRTTTVASMMDVMVRNYNQRTPQARLFEIGKIYIPGDDPAKLPTETDVITIGGYGKMDFYDIKGMCDAVFDQLKIEVKYVACTDNPTYHPGRTADIYINKKRIGTVGQIHPDVCDNYGINEECYVAQINFDELLNVKPDKISYKQLPKFPAVSRDIAMLVDDSVPVADIEAVIKQASGKMLESLSLFDVYKGKQIPDGKKSVAYAAIFRSADRTLTDDDVNKVFNKILKSLEHNLNAQLR